MRAWQRFMIRLARSGRVRQLVQEGSLSRRLAGRFVGGVDLAEAIERAQSLAAAGFRASLYFLGEYVEDPRVVEENVNEIIAAVRSLDPEGLDVHVSVDPTQIGLTLSDEVGMGNARLIGRTIARHSRGNLDCIMLDMEDESVVERTLAMHARLLEERVPTAVTLQACLRRSEEDLRALIRLGARVRLVKGAFAESSERAFVRRAEIHRRYLELAELLLSAEAAERGVFAAFATHDHRLLGALEERLRARPRPAENYEFEMLYGVRPSLQRRLRERGHPVRLYLPFGAQWWPYTARRIGERPANALFVWRSLWSS